MGYSAADSTKQKFTQKERDNESGLDYFLARYYSSAQGRFTSIDPALDSGRPIRPQTWNRDAYTLNNPMRFIDPSGLTEEDPQRENPQQEPPPIKVTIVPSVVQVFSNVELPNGKYMTGVGSLFKVTLTDANGDPLAEAAVKETNTRVEGTGDINERESTLKTDISGTFRDYVVRGRTTETADPQSPKSKEEIKTFKDAVNETPIKSTTEQTLAVTGNDKQKYEITYRRTITNTGSDGNLLKEKNREGLNVRVTYTTPVVKRVP